MHPPVVYGTSIYGSIYQGLETDSTEQVCKVSLPGTTLRGDYPVIQLTSLLFPLPYISILLTKPPKFHFISFHFIFISIYI
ncbi:hypothetical protein QVD17_22716 [Tagetes erecta]|uniref:Uncharacterized protein n=1 Tax=Tagetes erecta TaxID=13708 RepID=A0AAD8NU47_TARER|nr:hypothetical protein QVD17_22716 [Tagetes erecta]